MILYEGKAKQIYKTDNPNELVMFFKDDATAGNRAKEDKFEGKGELNCSITTKIFEKLNFPKNHFIKKLSKNELLVEKVDIIPLEVIIRNRAAGTFCKRYGVENGKKLENKIIEFCVKDDSLNDPPICEDSILALGICDYDTLSTLKKYSDFVSDCMTGIMSDIGFELVDMKLEFGCDDNGDILLADEICPDTMRLWENGKSFDKDLFRLDTGDLLQGYREVDRRLR